MQRARRCCNRHFVGGSNADGAITTTLPRAIIFGLTSGSLSIAIEVGPPPG